MNNKILQKEHRINIEEVVNKLQQMNATQPEIDFFVDAFKRTKSSIHVLLYIYKLCLKPNNNCPNTFDNLLQKYLFCISGAPNNKEIMNFIEFFFQISSVFTSIQVYVLERIEDNGYPSDPEAMRSIMLRSIREYFDAHETRTSTD